MMPVSTVMPQRIEQIAWMLFLKVYDAKEQDWEWDDDNYQSIIPEACRWQNWAVDDKSGTALTGDQLFGLCEQHPVPNFEETAGRCLYAHQEGHRADNLCRCQ